MVKSVLWPLAFGKQDGSFKLERIKLALNLLGNPQNKLKNVIHIAGTNGKGSTLAFIEKTLLESGYTTSSYISPSLIELNERFRINSNDIDDKTLLSNLDEVKQILQKHNFENELTFFEGLTAVAFYIFAKQSSDFNIIEVGLGGRFDATNVIQNKLATIITQISFDHTEYLGNTIQKITTEKCQIMQSDTLSVMSFQNNVDAYKVFLQNAKQIGVKNFYIYNEDFSTEILKDEGFIVKSKHFDDVILPKPSLEGYHQYYNASNAVFAAKIIAKKLQIEDKIINKNIAKAIGSTFWLSRMQKVFENQDLQIIVDGGHNEGSIYAIADFIQKKAQNGYKVNIIFGALQRKDISLLAQNISKYNIDKISQKIYLTQINTFEQSHNPEYIKQVFSEHFITNTEVVNDLESFFNSKISNNNESGNKNCFLVFGSLYLCGQVIDFFRKK